MSWLAKVREMSSDEIISMYLPLRCSVFHEFGWAKNAQGDYDGRDDYDKNAFHFGCFSDDSLLGAIRLVIAPTVHDLPSGCYIGPSDLFVGRLGELCKGVVNGQFRGRHIFSTLVCFGISKAREQGVSHLFLSAFDTDRIRRFYSHFGLVPCGAPFAYE